MTGLVRYEAARCALQAAHSVDEVKDIRDKAQAMAAYARQANDTEMVEWATDIKVRAERRAGELTRELPQNPRARTDLSGFHNDNQTKKSILAGLGVSEQAANRWEKLAAISDEKFEQAVAAAKEVAGEVTTAAVRRLAMGLHYSSATPEWETPQDLFTEIHAEFQFGVDVCATPQNAKCKTFYTAEQDGLSRKWEGVCWMNPPYGDVIAEWVKKAHESSKEGATVVCLVPARVDTRWWWDHCRYAEVRFLRGRLKFGNAETGAPFPSAVVIFGRAPTTKYWEWRTD